MGLSVSLRGGTAEVTGCLCCAVKTGGVPKISGLSLLTAGLTFPAKSDNLILLFTGFFRFLRRDACGKDAIFACLVAAPLRCFVCLVHSD